MGKFLGFPVNLCRKLSGFHPFPRHECRGVGCCVLHCRQGWCVQEFSKEKNIRIMPCEEGETQGGPWRKPGCGTFHLRRKSEPSMCNKEKEARTNKIQTHACTHQNFRRNKCLHAYFLMIFRCRHFHLRSVRQAVSHSKDRLISKLQIQSLICVPCAKWYTICI